MGRPYSTDLRERVVAAVGGGMSCWRAAQLFNVSASTAINWAQRLRESGSVAPGQMGGHKPRNISGAHRAWLAPLVLDRPISGKGFAADIKQMLMPTLSPGGSVIMDNLGSQKARQSAKPFARQAPNSCFCRSIVQTSTP